MVVERLWIYCGKIVYMLWISCGYPKRYTLERMLGEYGHMSEYIHAYSRDEVDLSLPHDDCFGVGQYSKEMGEQCACVCAGCIGGPYVRRSG